LSQLKPDEMRGLADRLRTHAQTVLLRHQPERHRDLVTAVALIDQFANLSTKILSSAAVIDRLLRLLGMIGGV